MLIKRIIPTLLLFDGCLVKTKNFNKFEYIGDPINTVRIFNELEVDEIILNDILAAKNRHSPKYEQLKEIASECFVPLAYGGGVSSIEQAEKLFEIGFEKVVLSTEAYLNPSIISALAYRFGSQAIVVSVDVKKHFLLGHGICTHGGRKWHRAKVGQWVKKIEKLGAGEIILTSVDREGTWLGLDIPLVKEISDMVDVPVIANGGVGSDDDIFSVLQNSAVSAVATGSRVVFQKKGMGVLISYPSRNLD